VVRTMRNRSAPLLAQMVIGTIIIKPLRLGPPTRSARLQAEAGEAVAGDFAGQFGLPAQIGAHRLLIAGVAVVVPENGVDTLIVRRLIGQAGEGPSVCPPRRGAANDQRDRPGGGGGAGAPPPPAEVRSVTFRLR
jgi:hypothetical protein